MTDPLLDHWASWICHRRHGDDSDEIRLTMERLASVRDRVLDNAAIGGNSRLLDIGTGDGLIGFGALARLDSQGHVIFSDISDDLLAEARTLAMQTSVLDRCSFVRTSADDISPIASSSVDAVTTRSVLAYVDNKQRALAEFARVLKPGGRM